MEYLRFVTSKCRARRAIGTADVLTSLCAAIVFLVLVFTGTPAFANNHNNGSECLPGIGDAFRENPAQ